MASLYPLALLLTQIITTTGFMGAPMPVDPGMYYDPYGYAIYDPYGGYYGYPYPPMMGAPPFAYGYYPAGQPAGDIPNASPSAEANQAPQGIFQCSSHDQCGGPYLCISGQCEEMEPTTIRCQSDNDCPQGGCKVTYCWQPPGTSAQGEAAQASQGQGTGNETTAAATPCAQQEDCAGDQMCGPDGTCVKGFSIEIQCKSDSDCDKKNRCKGGTCWTAGEPGSGKDGDYCKEHTDCNVKSVCQKKQCVAALPSLDKCLIDLMCKGKGRVCKYFHCWKPLGSLGGMIG